MSILLQTEITLQRTDLEVFTIQINAAADNFTVTTFKWIDNTIVVPFLDLSSAKAGNLGFVSIGADSNVIEPDVMLSAFKEKRESNNCQHEQQ